jgi:hypothetical protein
MRILRRGHDPYWGMEGRNIRRERRLRRLLELVVAFAIVALLLVVFKPIKVLGAGTSVNLDQWSTLTPTWQNGNLNASNSAYPEGGVVPFRLAIEGLSTGTHTIHINYDFTASGHKAYDFLATWNVWRGPNICGPTGGGISSMCPSLPASSSRALPSDPFVANGLSVNGAEVYSAASRRLTIWGGTITSITGPTHSGSVNASSSADFRVTFTANGPAVLLAWGGHIAQSRYWDLAAGGPRDGAGEVSGSPWHMRTLNLDGSGARNQDRSISPSAIVGEVPQFGLGPPTPTPRPSSPAVPAPTPTSPSTGPGAPATPRPFASPPPTSTAITVASRYGVDGAWAVVLVLGWAVVACGWLRIRARRRDISR